MTNPPRIDQIAAFALMLWAPAAVAQPLFPTQPKTDPYETQYLDSTGPRLKVEPRPAAQPAPASKFRVQPDVREGQTTYEGPSPIIDRPGRPPRAVSPPARMPRTVEKPVEVKPVEVKKPVSTARVETQSAPPRTKAEVKPLFPGSSKKPEAAPVTAKAPAPAPKMRILASPSDSTEGEIEEAREIESQAVGVSQSESLAIVSDDGSFRSSRFPVRMTVDLRQGYDSNVFTTPTNPEASWFSNIGARALYEFGTARTQGLLDLSGGYTYYYDRTGDPDDFDLRFGGEITHKVSPKLTVRANTYVAYEVEPDYGLVGGSNRRSGAYFYTNTEFGAAYTWTRRFSTDTTYKLSTLNYDEQSFGNFENRMEHTFANSYRLLLLPTTVAVMEYRFHLVDYFEQSFRDSFSNFVLLGADHSFSARLSGSFRTGAEFRDTRGKFQTSPYFQGDLRYALAERSSAEIRARYGLEQSDIASDLDREVFRIGIAATHGWTARISSYFTLDYNHSAYEEGTSINENTIETSVGVRYTINRHFSMELSYLYAQVISNDQFREYTRNRTFGSVRMQF